jgi:hypothetical protein
LVVKLNSRALVVAITVITATTRTSTPGGNAGAARPVAACVTTCRQV